MIHWLATLSVLLASALHFGHDFHASREFIALILGTLWIVGLVTKRTHWSVGLAFAWTLLSAAWVFGQPVSPYQANGSTAALSFDSLTAETYIAVVLISVMVAFANGRMIETLLSVFGFLCVADSLYVLAKDCGGFFGNPSMNACVIAITYPILKRHKQKPKSSFEVIYGLITLTAPLAAVIISRSNIALAALVAAFMVPAIFSPRGRRLLCVRDISWISLALICVGHWVLGAKFGQDNGRFIIWKTMTRWLFENHAQWLGTGAGTFFLIGPNIQAFELHRISSFFFWMHNDWLQILFEMGAAGLAAILLMVGCAFRRAYMTKRPWLISTMTAYVVTACGNYPMHLPVTGFLGAVLIVAAFSK